MKKDLKRAYLTPAIIFAASLILIIGVDFSLRKIQGIENGLGLPEFLWFSLQVIAGLATAFTFWKRTKQLGSRSRLGYFTLLLMISLVLYTLIIYSYVLGTAIDSF
jgi:hypothetical protein